MKKIVKIATRKSPLALWQANFVKDLLTKKHPSLHFELVPMTTSGDILLQDSLATKGGKGLFIKELEHALLNHKADLAVHSMKDLPVQMTDDFIIAAVLERASAQDVFVSNQFNSLSQMPKGAVVGTSSLRRVSQLQHQYAQLVFKPLRGNVNTRLEKLNAKEMDGIVLAEAGMVRLGLEERIKEVLAVEICLPAVGQGALAIECQAQDDWIKSLVQPFNHPQTAQCVAAERAMSLALGGSCQLPVAGYAILKDDVLWLRGRVGSPDGRLLFCSQAQGAMSEAIQLGQTVANSLLQQGAQEILSQIQGAC